MRNRFVTRQILCFGFEFWSVSSNVLNSLVIDCGRLGIVFACYARSFKAIVVE